MSSLAASTPGTPSRSQADASPIITPRTRIRNLMASVDDSDSSGDNASKSPSKKLSPRRKSSSKSPKAREGSVPLFLPRDESDSSVDGRSNHDGSAPSPMRAPRGALASRMRGIAPSKDDASKTASSPAQDGPAPRSRNRTPADESDSELPVVPRRRRAGLAGTSSPASLRKSSVAAPAGISDSDSDDTPANLAKNPRFLELVARKRREREEKEMAEREAAEARRARQVEEEGEMQISSDSENDRRLTSQAPKRKAGKKAMQEMMKETQRLARNMQLAHEARTRKKITKQSLFEKFGFKPESEGSTGAAGAPAAPPADSSSVLASESDVVPHSTPNSSPPPQETSKEGPTVSLDDDEEMLDVADLFAGLKKAQATEATPKPDKDKGVAPSAPDEDTPRPRVDKGKCVAPVLSSPKRRLAAMPVVRVALPTRTADDSDSDLEFVDPAKEEPVKEEHNEAERLVSEKQKLINSLIKQRKYRAPIRPDPKKHKSHISAKLLHQHLLQKGRLQAVQERQEKIEELRARGIIVQTAEEREKEQQIVENLLEKARQEALEIRRREKLMESKKNGQAGNDEDGDDEDDGDWLESEIPEDEAYGLFDEEEGSNEMADEEASESGSDEDVVMEQGGGDESTVVGDTKSPHPSPTKTPESVFPSLTTESQEVSQLEDIAPPADDDSDDGGFALLKRKASRVRARVIEDDEDHQAEVAKPTGPAPPGAAVPPIFKQLAAPKPTEISMTQLFAGSASAPGGNGPETVAERMNLLRKGPEHVLPKSQEPESLLPGDRVPNTQLENLDLDRSQDESQDHTLPRLELIYEPSQSTQSQTQTQTQDIPEPTQDVGFDAASSPAPKRFESAPPATDPIQKLGGTKDDDDDDDEFEPAPRRRLMRRGADFSDDEDEANDSASSGAEGPRGNNAFAVMKAAAKRKVSVPSFDKKNSEAKGMVHEQAEESEDEYAGLGGASDDSDVDQDAEGFEQIKDLIDNDTQVNIDESDIAAWYAAREKMQDEKDVNKLLRDLKSGLLRKKRGAGALDLDDSDEELIAQERRKRRKRMQMAQIRKQLMEQNDDVGRIANDPKKAAFFKVLEDNQSDADDDFLDRVETDTETEMGSQQSQKESERQATPTSSGDQKSDSQEGSNAENIPPPAKDCPARAKKPRLAEVRETLSFLVEEASYLQAAGSESDGETESQFRHRRTGVIVDRTLISRSSSSSTSVTSATTKLAFATESAAVAGFRVPTLLRRTTTGLSSESQGSGGSASTERSLGTDSQGFRKSGARNRGVNYRAREKSRTGVVEKAKAKRKEEVVRKGRSGIAGMLGEGAWE